MGEVPEASGGLRDRGSEGERGNRFANALGFVFCLVSFLIIQVCVK